MTDTIKFIPLTSDTMFKELFGKNKKALSLLLSWQLNLDYNYIYNNLKYLNCNLLINKVNNYKFTTDILIRIKDVIINIEMNRKYWKGLENRNLAYINKIYASQFKKGNKKKDFRYAKKVIQINYNCFNEPKDKRYGKSKMYDLINKKITSEKVTQVNINLAKVKEMSYNKVTRKLTGIEKIARLLLSEDRKDVDFEMEKELEETIKEIEKLSCDEEMIELFDEEEEAELIKNSIENEALERGEKIGIKKGRKLGISQGINQGIAETVKNMLKMNLDIDIISKASGMSKKDILKLKAS